MSATAIELAKVDVTIQGLPPGLLMASKRIMEAPATGKKGVQRTAAEEAELHAHWVKVGKQKFLAIPWTNLYKSICDASGQFKWSGRKTMAQIVAATISCETDMVSLGSDEYEVYEEWVRIPPRTGAMVKIGRPRIRQWQASFAMLVDPELYGKGVGILEEIINHAGKMIGIGPWRPGLKGPYGRFRVTRFEIR